MIINNNLTSHQVSLIILALQDNIDSMRKKSKQSAELGIVTNVVYYNQRISQCQKIFEIMNNTIGMKVE